MLIVAFGAVLTSSSWTSSTSNLNSTQAENFAFATVHAFHATNRCFVGTLYGLNPKSFLAGKENNESFTFKEMLKQEDQSDLIEAMKKEVSDHENWGHCGVISH